jgi:hypothetical protein
MTLTITWNRLGFHLLDARPKGRTFNTEYYLDNVLTALLPPCQQVDGRKLIIHANNARSHRMPQEPSPQNRITASWKLSNGMTNEAVSVVHNSPKPMDAQQHEHASKRSKS